MASAYTDDELTGWLRAVSENGSGFLRTIAEAAFIADLPHYAILRSALLKLKEFESLSGNSSVLDRKLDEERKPGESDPPRIRCPLCDWSPRKEDKWFCACGNEWNTFDTGGVCPTCLHQWTETQCLSCSRWTPHSLWYAQ